MANEIRLKRRASGGNAGAPSSLMQAEPAFNENDSILYLGYGDNGSGVATSIIAIGGSGAFATLGTTQTISGSKTFSGSVSLGSSATATTPSASDNSTSIATTAFVATELSNFSSSLSVGSDSGSGSIDLGSNTLSIAGGTGLESTFNNTTKALTINDSDSGVTAASYGATNKSLAITVNAKGRITAASASNISITHTQVSDFDTGVRTNRLNQMAAPTANVGFNSQRITGLADPVDANDAVSKQYADALVAGLDVKDSVRVATTANITLSGTQTIDGTSVVAGDRVLVKDQTTASENGLYVVASGSWARATDADNTPGDEVSSGMFVFVEDGSANANAGFVLTTTGAITLGTTGLSFVQYSGAGQISAGDGISKSGNTLSTRLTANGGLVFSSAGFMRLDLSASSISGVLSLADGGTGGGANTATPTTLALTDGFVCNDGGTMVQVALSDLVTFLEDGSTSGFNIDAGTF